MQKQEILQIKDLSMGFESRSGVTPILDHVNLTVHKNEIVAIVGESGCGKSVTAKSVMRLLPSPPAKYTGGEILFHGEDLLKMDEKRLRSIRGDSISMIFQEPLTSLNPVLTIGDQIGEAFRLHRKGMSKAEIREATIELLKKVRIPAPETRLKNYPGQFSGGMRQRIVIAIALSCHPKILICDEPTTALDVTIQAQIIALIRDLQKELKFTTIYITHDLGVVANVADRVGVMYGGQIIEYGNVEEVFFDPRHPYTWALLSSLPQLGIKGQELYYITGTPPSLYNQIKGDAFAPRNEHALKIDFEMEPPFFPVSETHYAKTWLLDPRAPKLEKPEIIQNLHEKIKKMTDKGGAFHVE